MTVRPAPSEPVSRARDLVALFCPIANFGGITAAGEVPQPYRRLLDHRQHMTATMEDHFGGPVQLEVVASRTVEDAASSSRVWYVREILLRRPAPGGGTMVVQYGIVKIDLSTVDQVTAAAIRAERIPLGRILIDAGVMRDVQHVALVEIAPGPHLARHLGPGRTFGRVAHILLNGRPAVELLEIAMPGLAG